jgi:hypothetical protein
MRGRRRRFPARSHPSSAVRGHGRTATATRFGRFRKNLHSSIDRTRILVRDTADFEGDASDAKKATKWRLEEISESGVMKDPPVPDLGSALKGFPGL